MSGAYYGDFPASHTGVCMVFDSFAGSTGAPSATSNFANTDIQIYKDGGTTQRSSANGITVSTSFDSSTGLQMIVIDLSDNTDAGFYAAGHEYNVAVADVTIDSQTVRFWVGSFSIERAGGVLALLKAGTAKVTLADGVAHGGTLGSSTATLALSRLNVTSQTSNTAAVTATGNGTGNGATISSGSGATGTGIAVSSAATNGAGLTITGVGTGNGVTATGGATGAGILGSGGGTSGAGIRAVANAGNSSGMAIQGSGANPGLQCDGGATGVGFYAAGGATSGGGVLIASTSGNGIDITPIAGHGINIAANGTSKHGILSTGGTGGTSDGVKAVAGTGGVDIRGNITGNLVGVVSTLTTYTGNTVQTGDSFVAIAGVQSDTDNIQTRLPAALVGGRMDASVGAMAANVLTAAATAADFGTEIGAAVWAVVMDGTRTAIQYMRGFAGPLLGKASGLGTTNAKYRDIADSKDVVDATVDADGNRTAITLDLT